MGLMMTVMAFQMTVWNVIVWYRLMSVRLLEPMLWVMMDFFIVKTNSHVNLQRKRIVCNNGEFECSDYCSQLIGECENPGTYVLDSNGNSICVPEFEMS